jgi:formylmethanofuran dehydrogenase subunit A
MFTRGGEDLKNSAVFIVGSDVTKGEAMLKSAEAATAPLTARHTHEEPEDTPMVGKGVFITMGNNHFIMKCIRDGQREKARDYVARLLGASRGYGIKIVNCRCGHLADLPASKSAKGLIYIDKRCILT